MFSISFFFTFFNEKITRRQQFSSNEQILHKHVKYWENMDFYTDFSWYTDFYTDLWVYGFIRIFNFWKNGFLPLSSGNTDAKMDVPRNEYLECEVCVVIRFLTCIGQIWVEIHEQWKCVYGLKVVAVAMVGSWMEQFRGGRLDVHNMPRSRRLSNSMSFFNIQVICDLLVENRRMSLSKIFSRLQLPDCVCSLVHKIVHQVLDFQTLSSQWVPWLLPDDHKEHLLTATLSFLMSYHRNGPSLLDHIIMRNETYIHYMIPKMKWQSMEQFPPRKSVPKKKAKVS